MVRESKNSCLVSFVQIVCLEFTFFPYKKKLDKNPNPHMIELRLINTKKITLFASILSPDRTKVIYFELNLRAAKNANKVTIGSSFTRSRPLRHKRENFVK